LIITNQVVSIDSLEINEVQSMYQSYGIHISFKDLLDLFRSIKPQNPSHLTFEEFKRFSYSTSGAKSIS